MVTIQENTEVQVDDKKTTEFVMRLRPSFVKILAFILAVTTLGFAGTTTYLYRQNQQLKNPQAVAQAELQSVLKKVSKLMTLPEGEEPTLATVTNPEKLTNEAFFANAKKGDKVLIYTKAKKVILYDPQANKVLNVGPLNPDAIKKTDATVPTATDTKTQTMK